MRICFVTNELHPVAPGGIGRLMYNFAVDNAARHYGAEFHYLFPATELAQRTQLTAALGALGRVHFCGERDRPPGPFGRALQFIRRDDWNFERSYLIALDYLFGLTRIQHELGIEFDVVEFPDFGGWAFAALQAKAAGLEFASTRIAVRLHSSLGLICRHERFYHQPSEYFSAVFDQERYCLAHADLVVSHLPGIADLNAAHYRFDAEWRARVRVEFPPILLDEDSQSDAAPPRSGEVQPPTFVFSSRLQPFKRPDLFINGGVRFLRMNPGLEARFLLVSYGWDEDYIAYLEGLIPDAMKQRIVIERGLTAAQRRAILKTAIVVVPSDYESLCLFAYEAALLGRTVILNRDCEAFGRCERWRDGENCLLFGDDFVGLAETLREALSFTPTHTVDARADVPYWATALPRLSGPDSEGSAPSVSAHIVALSDGRAAALADFCFRLSRTVTEGVQVTVMVPDSEITQTAQLAALVASFGWRLAFYSGPRIRPAEVQRLAAGISEEILVLVPQAFNLQAGFIRLGLKCMAQNPRLAIFSTQVCLENDRGGDAILALFPGQLPSVALHRAAVPHACMLRVSTLGRHTFDERARDRWLDTFCREVVLAGGEVVIAPLAALSAPRAEVLTRANRLIDATLRDDMGLKAGMLPRLLSLHAASGADNWEDNPSLVLTGSDLVRMTRVWPIDVHEEWEPVRFKDEVGSVLIHPLPTGLVVGHVRLTLRTKPHRVECLLRNAHAENLGFEAMAMIASEPVTPEALGALEHSAPSVAGSEWHFIGPQAIQAIGLAAVEFARGDLHLYVATRIRPGTNNYYAWAALDSVKIF